MTWAGCSRSPFEAALPLPVLTGGLGCVGTAREGKLLLSPLEPNAFLKLLVELQKGELCSVVTLHLECSRKGKNLNDIQR